MDDHAPISLPLSAQGYAAANEAFRQCWAADRDEVLSCLRAHLPAPSAHGLDILGIGVGDGSFDLQIIDCIQQHLGDIPMRYVALDPNEAQLHGFQANLARSPRPTVQFSFIAQPAEAYQPERQFDLIHFIHSLYHMPDHEQQLILGAHARLRPGGRLLIALSSEQGGIYQMMQRYWGEIDYSFFTHGLFGHESLMAILDRQGIPYEAARFPDVAIDVSACFQPGSALGQQLLDFIMQADMQRAPAELRERVLATLGQLSYERGGRRWLAHPSGVFVASAPLG